MIDEKEYLQKRKDSLGAIDVFTHGFRVTTKDPRVATSCRITLKDWAIYGEKTIEKPNGDRVKERVLQQTYGAALPGNEVFWFHKGQFKDFQTDLLRYSLMPEDFNMEKMDTYKPSTLKKPFSLKENRVPYPYQIEAKEFSLEPVKDGDHFSKLIAMPAGTGKSQPNDTPIQTPSGYIQMGGIKVGMEVMTPYGTPTKVTGVFPQGLKDTYLLTFADGRQTKASGDHLWTVHSWDWHSDGEIGAWKTINTIQAKKYVDTKSNKVSVQLCQHPDIPDIDLPLDPYILGLLLGDGTFPAEYNNSVLFSNSDDYFAKVFDELLPETGTHHCHDGVHRRFEPKVRYTENELLIAVNNTGLRGVRSKTKYIPEIYFKASKSQKMRLIRGLMDTDGCPMPDGGEFSSISKELAEGLMNLIRSVGGQANIRDSIPTYTHQGIKKEGNRVWSVGIRFDHPEELFDLPSKQKRISLNPKCRDKLKLRIENIEFCGLEESTCISVEHPDHLYVCNDYITTHNTITLCSIATENNQRTVIGVLKKYAQKWPADILSNINASPKDIMVIEKTTQLRGVIDMCKTQGNKKLPPYIVITLSTLRGFIDSYELDPDSCVEDYGCAPYELWELLDCGLFGIDEAHEHLNTVFKVAMYMHGPKLVALSATMRSDSDEHQEKLQQTLFPNFKRFEGIKPKKYNDLEFIAYSFGFDSLKKIRYQAFGRTDYSHAVFEQSIMRHPVILRDYLDMCVNLIDYGYTRLYQKGDKCIIFVGIVEMADKFMTCLTAHFPKLNVVRYCKSEGDKYADMMNGDVIVTTIQSGGTGIDVKGLTYLGFFSMVNSSKSNIQTFYRVREFKDRETRVSMPFNRQNPKHIKYTQFRKEIFKDMAKTMQTFNYNQQLGP